MSSATLANQAAILLQTLDHLLKILNDRIKWPWHLEPPINHDFLGVTPQAVQGNKDFSIEEVSITEVAAVDSLYHYVESFDQFGFHFRTRTLGRGLEALYSAS
jgi:hypothetical protein